MAREILLARFRTEWTDGGFNLPLQIHQAPFAIIDSHPDDPGQARVGEKPDAFGAQRQGPGVSTNSADGLLQSFDTIRRDSAEEPQREMKLVGPGPASHVAWYKRLQFLLNTDDFVPDRTGKGNRHKQPEWNG